MGFDKATLSIGGEPLWQRQFRVLAELNPEATWVSARNRPAWCPADVEVILDQPPSCGPLSGVTAGLERLQTSHLLVLAIDLPNVSAEHLRKLCNLAKPGRGVIPRNQDWFEPLCAIYPREAAAEATQALGKNASLQQLARTLIDKSRAEVYDIPAKERPLYLNANQPSDLEG